MVLLPASPRSPYAWPISFANTLTATGVTCRSINIYQVNECIFQYFLERQNQVPFRSNKKSLRWRGRLGRDCRLPEMNSLLDTNLFGVEQKGAKRIAAKCVLMALTMNSSRLLREGILCSVVRTRYWGLQKKWGWEGTSWPHGGI